MHLQKDVPNSSMLGELWEENSEDCFLVLKSFGTSWWTDKNGNERYKFGPMYLHFEKNCLQNFDSENPYGPSQNFDYSGITFGLKQKLISHWTWSKPSMTFSSIHIYFWIFVYTKERYEYGLCFLTSVKFSLLVFIFDVWFLKVIFTVCLIKLGIGVIFINLFSYKLRFYPRFIRHSA